MHWMFFILAGVILISALAAVLLPKLVHCVLCLILTFVGLAAIFLQLGAQFIGLAQILVYVGAVAVLMVFALMLTRNSEASPQTALASPFWFIGVAVAGLVFGCLTVSILASKLPTAVLPPAPALNAQRIGQKLMTDYVVPLETVGLLLTAAMIGAVILAMPEKRGPRTTDN